jgi:hypothetical protein
VQCPKCPRTLRVSKPWRTSALYHGVVSPKAAQALAAYLRKKQATQQSSNSKSPRTLGLEVVFDPAQTHWMRVGLSRGVPSPCRRSAVSRSFRCFGMYIRDSMSGWISLSI